MKFKFVCVFLLFYLKNNKNQFCKNREFETKEIKQDEEKQKIKNKKRQSQGHSTKNLEARANKNICTNWTLKEDNICHRILCHFKQKCQKATNLKFKSIQTTTLCLFYFFMSKDDFY